jgi:hypothetical protein
MVLFRAKWSHNSMIHADENDTLEEVRSEFESVRSSFHALLGSLSESDMRRPSLNPGWTNGEIIAHMLFGFVVVDALVPMARLWGRLPKNSSKPFAWLLNALRRPFHWFNALGARMQGKVFTYQRVGKLLDSICEALLKKAASIKKEEWQRGMYYPTKWDPNFSDFMTLEKVFHYPVIHFHYHVKQISHRN